MTEFGSTKLHSKSLDFDNCAGDSKFLFKNRKFVPVERGLSTASSSQYSDSDSHNLDWDSFSEDDEIEVPTEPTVSSVLTTNVFI